MNKYELTLVLDPHLADEEIPATLNQVNQLITEKQGEVSGVNQWGKRKLAYPIRENLEGNYALVQFQLKAESVRELESGIRRMPVVLRHLVVKKEN